MLYSKANIANINVTHSRERVDEQEETVVSGLGYQSMESKPALSTDSSNVTTPAGVGKVPPDRYLTLAWQPVGHLQIKSLGGNKASGQAR